MAKKKLSEKFEKFRNKIKKYTKKALCIRDENSPPKETTPPTKPPVIVKDDPKTTDLPPATTTRDAVSPLVAPPRVSTPQAIRHVSINPPKQPLPIPDNVRMFERVKALENKYADRPTGAFLAAADSVRMRYAKCLDDPGMPQDYKEDFKKYNQLILELKKLVDKEEKDRPAYTPDSQIEQKRRYLVDEINARTNNHHHALVEHQAQIAELNLKRNELKELEDLLPPGEETHSLHLKSAWEHFKNKFRHHERDYTEKTEQLGHEVQAMKSQQGCSTCHVNLDLKLKMNLLDLMKKNLSNFHDADPRKAREGAAAILKHNEVKLNETHKNLVERSPVDATLGELKEQLGTVQNKIKMDEALYPNQITRELMIQLVRTYEIISMLGDTTKRYGRDDKNRVSLDNLLNTLTHAEQKMVKAAEKLYCPAVNNFTFKQFDDEFRKLADKDKKALLNGTVPEFFMPEHIEFASRARPGL